MPRGSTPRPDPAALREIADQLAPDGAPEDTFSELEQTAASQLHQAADWIASVGEPKRPVLFMSGGVIQWEHDEDSVSPLVVDWDEVEEGGLDGLDYAERIAGEIVAGFGESPEAGEVRDLLRDLRERIDALRAEARGSATRAYDLTDEQVAAIKAAGIEIGDGGRDAR